FPSEDLDVQEFSTVCFNEFVKVARGRATPTQIANLPHCGWDIVAALKLQREQREDADLNAPVPVLSVSGESYSLQCLRLFEKAVTVPGKSSIEVDGFSP
ncbi:hypothetical protein PENTCL1PPCAC_4506, partial [Pristionchus entomophagus]